MELKSSTYYRQLLKELRTFPVYALKQREKDSVARRIAATERNLERAVALEAAQEQEK